MGVQSLLRPLNFLPLLQRRNLWLRCLRHCRTTEVPKLCCLFGTNHILFLKKQDQQRSFLPLQCSHKPSRTKTERTCHSIHNSWKLLNDWQDNFTSWKRRNWKIKKDNELQMTKDTDGPETKLKNWYQLIVLPLSLSDRKISFPQRQKLEAEERNSYQANKEVYALFNDLQGIAKEYLSSVPFFLSTSWTVSTFPLNTPRS